MGSLGKSTDKWAIVTGVSESGIGYYVTKGLAEHNYNVILASRTKERTEQAIQSLVNEHKINKNLLHFQQLDVSNLHAVEQFAQSYIHSNKPLNILVCNAGVYKAPVTKEGIEGTFAANYLGHYLLTKLLIPVLSKTDHARVVNVASTMHRFGNLDYEYASKHHSNKSYSQSKLYQILAARQLHYQYSNQGISFYSVHPGAVNSNFYKWLGETGQKISKYVFSLWFITAEEGAQTALSAALDQPTNTKSSLYLSPYKVFPSLGTKLSEMVGSRYWQKVEVVEPSPDAQNDDVGKKLVEYSDKLIDQVLNSKL